jgi:hypothetical protein
MLMRPPTKGAELDLVTCGEMRASFWTREKIFNLDVDNPTQSH